MYRNTYRLTLESDPLSASSAAQDAYWLMLGDLMLDPARTSNVRREALNTRAQQEHERLSEQVGQALDKYSNPEGGDILTRVFGYGHHSSRTHATHGAEARPPDTQIMEESDAKNAIGSKPTFEPLNLRLNTIETHSTPSDAFTSKDCMY
jgi:hypothetical protein